MADKVFPIGGAINQFAGVMFPENDEKKKQAKPTPKKKPATKNNREEISLDQFMGEMKEISPEQFLQEISGGQPQQQEDTDAFSAGLRGFGAGLTGIAESAGSGLSMIGAHSGSPTMQDWGNKFADYWQSLRQEHLDAPDSIKGSIWDKPELMTNAAWLSYNLGQATPSIAASMIPGAGAGRAVNFFGTKLKWTPKVVERLARLSRAVFGGGAGGALEGTSTYQELIRKGVDPKTAVAAGEMMALASAGLNAASLDKMFKVRGPGFKNAVISYLQKGGTEALTEYLEEPSEGGIKMLLGEATLEDVVQQMKEGLNVVPISFILGGAAGELSRLGNKNIKEKKRKEHRKKVSDLFFDENEESEFEIEEVDLSNLSDKEEESYVSQAEEKILNFVFGEGIGGKKEQQLHEWQNQFAKQYADEIRKIEENNDLNQEQKERLKKESKKRFERINKEIQKRLGVEPKKTVHSSSILRDKKQLQSTEGVHNFVVNNPAQAADLLIMTEGKEAVSRKDFEEAGLPSNLLNQQERMQFRDAVKAYTETIGGLPVNEQGRQELKEQRPMKQAFVNVAKVLGDDSIPNREAAAERINALYGLQQTEEVQQQPKPKPQSEPRESNRQSRREDLLSGMYGSGGLQEEVEASSEQEQQPPSRAFTDANYVNRKTGKKLKVSRVTDQRLLEAGWQYEIVDKKGVSSLSRDLPENYVPIDQETTEGSIAAPKTKEPSMPNVGRKRFKGMMAGAQQEKPLEEMGILELQDEARRKGLKFSGSASQLRSRLRNARFPYPTVKKEKRGQKPHETDEQILNRLERQEEQRLKAEQAQEEEEVQEIVEEPVQEPESVQELQPQEPPDLDNMTYNQLRKEAKARGIPAKGNKRQLLSKLKGEKDIQKESKPEQETLSAPEAMEEKRPAPSQPGKSEPSKTEQAESIPEETESKPKISKETAPTKDELEDIEEAPNSLLDDETLAELEKELGITESGGKEPTQEELQSIEQEEKATPKEKPATKKKSAPKKAPSTERKGFKATAPAVQLAMKQKGKKKMSLGKLHKAMQEEYNEPNYSWEQFSEDIAKMRQRGEVGLGVAKNPEKYPAVEIQGYPFHYIGSVNPKASTMKQRQGEPGVTVIDVKEEGSPTAKPIADTDIVERIGKIFGVPTRYTKPPNPDDIKKLEESLKKRKQKHADMLAANKDKKTKTKYNQRELAASRRKMKTLEKRLKLIKGLENKKGEYNNFSRVIRLGSRLSRPLLIQTHEVGHHIIETTDILDQLNYDQHHDLANLDYEPGRFDVEEGFAEYLTAYLASNKDVTQRIAPAFTKKFEAFLESNPDIKKKVVKSRALVTQWRDQGLENMAKSKWTQTKGGYNPLAPFWESVRDWVGGMFFHVYQGVKWKGSYVELFEKEYLKAGGKESEPGKKLSDLFKAFNQAGPAYAQRAIEDGVFDMTTGEKIGPSLSDGLGMIDTAEYENWVTWIYARHALEMHKKGLEPGMGEAEAEYFYDKYKNERWEEAANKVTEFNQSLVEMMVRSNVLTRKQADRILGGYETYIPLKRVFNGSFFKRMTSSNRHSPTSPIKRRYGGSQKIYDPIYSTIEQTTRFYERAQKQTVINKAIEMAISTKGLGETFEWIQPAEELVNLDVDIYMPDAMRIGNNNYHTAIINGKRQTFRIDKDFYEALTNMQFFELPWFLEMTVGKVARGIKLGATGINLGFGGQQIIRDNLTYLAQKRNAGDVKSELKESIRPLDVMAGYIAHSYNKMHGRESNHIHKLYEEMGGMLSTRLGLDRRRIRNFSKELMRDHNESVMINGIKHPVEAIRNLVSITEIGPRIAEFENVLESHGYDMKKVRSGEIRPQMHHLIDAVNAAHDVTTDFRRMGKYMQFANRLIPYLNASVEAMDKTMRTFKNNPKRAFLFSAGMVATSMAYWAMRHDDDDYKESPPWLRYGYWVIKGEDGQPMIRISKPYDWGWTVSGATMALMDLYNEQDPKFMKDYVNAVSKIMQPPWQPAGLTTIFEVTWNYDMFRDQPIVSPYSNVSPEYQYKPHTTLFSRQVGRWLGRSPAKLDHLFNGFTGGAYKRLMVPLEKIGTGKVQDLEPVDIPLVRSFTLRSDYARSTSELWDLKNEVETQYADQKHLVKKGKRDNLSQELLLRKKEVNDYTTIASDLYELLKEKKDRSERFQYEKYLVGLSRYAIGKEPLDRYPNPLTDKDLPEDVKKIVMDKLQTRIMQATAPGHFKENSLEYKYAKDFINKTAYTYKDLNRQLQKEYISRYGNLSDAYYERAERLRKVLK